MQLKSALTSSLYWVLFLNFALGCSVQTTTETTSDPGQTTSPIDSALNKAEIDLLNDADCTVRTSIDSFASSLSDFKIQYSLQCKTKSFPLNRDKQLPALSLFQKRLEDYLKQANDPNDERDRERIENVLPEVRLKIDELRKKSEQQALIYEPLKAPAEALRKSIDTIGSQLASLENQNSTQNSDTKPSAESYRALVQRLELSWQIATKSKQLAKLFENVPTQEFEMFHFATEKEEEADTQSHRTQLELRESATGLMKEPTEVLRSAMSRAQIELYLSVSLRCSCQTPSDWSDHLEYLLRSDKRMRELASAFDQKLIVSSDLPFDSLSLWPSQPDPVQWPSEAAYGYDISRGKADLLVDPGRIEVAQFIDALRLNRARYHDLRAKQLATSKEIETLKLSLSKSTIQSNALVLAQSWTSSADPLRETKRIFVLFLRILSKVEVMQKYDKKYGPVYDPENTKFNGDYRKLASVEFVPVDALLGCGFTNNGSLVADQNGAQLYVGANLKCIDYMDLAIDSAFFARRQRLLKLNPRDEAMEKEFVSAYAK